MKYTLANNEDFQIQLSSGGIVSIPNVSAGTVVQLATINDLQQLKTTKRNIDDLSVYTLQDLWHLSSESESADLVLVSKSGYTTIYSDRYFDGEYELGAFQLTVNDYRPAGGTYRVAVNKRVLDPLTSRPTWLVVVETQTSYQPIVEVSSESIPIQVFTYQSGLVADGHMLVTDAGLSAQLEQLSSDVSAKTMLSAASFGEWAFTQAMLDAELTVFSDSTSDFTLSIANKALLVGDYNSASLSVTQNGLSAAFYSTEDPDTGEQQFSGDARWMQIGFKAGDVIATRQAQSYVLGSQTDKPLAAAGGSFTQVQADWNEADASSPAYIQNKPTIPSDKPTRIYNVSGTDALDDKGQLFMPGTTGNYFIVDGVRYDFYGGQSNSRYEYRNSSNTKYMLYNLYSDAGEVVAPATIGYSGNRAYLTAILNPLAGDDISPSTPISGWEFHKLTFENASLNYARFALESMPIAWVANTLYSIGICVTYNGKAYRCIELNSDASFTSSKWQEIPTLDGISATLGDIETALHTINNGSN